MTDAADITLVPMGVGEPETFRARVYHVPESDEQRRARHLREVHDLASTAEGCVGCPAYDRAIGELCALLRWEWRDAPGGGRLKVWRLK